MTGNTRSSAARSASMPRAAPAEERFRLQLGEVIFQHLLPRLESESRQRLGTAGDNLPALQAARRQQQAGNWSGSRAAVPPGRLQAEPRNADAWQLLGERPLRSRQAAEADRRLPACPEPSSHRCRTPTIVWAWPWPARATQKPLATSARPLQLQPDHGEALSQLGLRSWPRRDSGESHRLLRADPPSASDGRGDAAQSGCGPAVARRAAGEAAQSLERAVKCSPTTPKLITAWAASCTSWAGKSEPSSDCGNCLQFQPSHAGACNNLGLVLTEAKQLHEAVDRFAACGTAAAGPMKEAHNNLGLAYTDLGRFAEAEASSGKRCGWTAAMRRRTPIWATPTRSRDAWRRRWLATSWPCG